MLADSQVFAPMPISEKGIRKSTRPAPMISIPTAEERLLVKKRITWDYEERHTVKLNQVIPSALQNTPSTPYLH